MQNDEGTSGKKPKLEYTTHKHEKKKNGETSLCTQAQQVMQQSRLEDFLKELFGVELVPSLLVYITKHSGRAGKVVDAKIGFSVIFLSP